MTAAPCTLVPNPAIEGGCYYLGGSPITVSLVPVDATNNNSKITSPIAVGATTYTIVNGWGVTVATGTMSASATLLTVISAGLVVGTAVGPWASGITAGYYTVFTGSGTNLVVSGNFVISNADLMPTTGIITIGNTTYTSGTPNAGWMPGTEDRDNYGYDPAGVQGPSASQIVTNFGNDSYFTGTQDSARPHRKWVACSLQGSVQIDAVGALSNGVNVSTFAGAGVLNCTGVTSSFPSSGTIVVNTSTGVAVLTYTGIAASTFTGCSTIQGTGTLATNNVVVGHLPVTPAQWAALATALVTGGYTGVFYELPSNEPENSGYGSPPNMPALLAVWNACALAVKAIDATANILGWCSAGVYNGATIANVATFLAGVLVTPAGFSNHMENSHQNMSNIVMLRQYFGSLQAQFAASGFAGLDYWNTETGIEGGQYFVQQPVREARQRVVIELVMEELGIRAENDYQFSIWDHHGSGLGTYQYDNDAADGYGNTRAGAAARHVWAQFKYGKPLSGRVKLSFGPTGSVGDSLFFGGHYTAAGGDGVVLVTNGIDSATVTLNVSATGVITYWDGWGSPSTVTVSGGTITVPVGMLPTYIFLPANTTVSVVDTDQGAVAFSNGTNLAQLGTTTIVNESATNITGVINDGSFAQNNAGIPGTGTPYTDNTVPGEVVIGNLLAPCAGYAIMSSGPAWQASGCGLVSVSVTAQSSTIDSYTCASALSIAVPSASNVNSDDPCTRTSFWSGAFARLVRFAAPVPAGNPITITIATGYGGQPDAAASVNTTGSNLSPTYPTYFENDPKQIQVAEVQAFQGSSTPVTPASVGLMMLYEG